MEKIDISNMLDYVIVDKFPNMDLFFSEEVAQKAPTILSAWKKYVKSRLTNLSIIRRFGIGPCATGTMLLGFYSSNPFTGASDMWSIRGLADDEAKVLSLWFNSTINLLQIYLQRKETRGIWMQLDEYALQEEQILNLSVLSESEKEFLLQTFNEIKNEDFITLHSQLKNKFPSRVKIDRAILKILGFDDDEIDKILESIYSTLAEDIERLEALMKGK
jgi:hypothetical protein